MSNVLTFDVSGEHGEDGRDGSHGRDGRRGGGNGRNGGDATRPTPGRDGGSIYLKLRSGAGADDVGGDEVAIEARLDPSVGQVETTENVFDAAVAPDLELLARGGDGGDGGNGGNGGDGGRGSRGRNATKRRSGGRGGRGGNGGDGGRGTSGADGGDGGAIAVEINGRDAYLLMAVEAAEAPRPLVEPGEGGERGRHGKGGSGGRGGPGGRSKSWTERDSNGNRRRRRKSGGSRGPSGRRGRTPSTPLYDGEPGNRGRFEIRVRTDDGRYTFPSRFDLEITGFDYEEAPSKNVDGVFEFGQEVLVRDLAVRNIGAMPTPPHQRIRLELASGEWVLPLDQALFVEDSLAPGEEYTHPGTLRFRIARPPEPPVGEPLVVTEPIRPHAYQLGVEIPPESGEAPFRRRYENADYTRPLTARYPVENRDGVEALRSLAHGERTRQRFEIHNISHEPLGLESSRNRGLALQIEWQDGMVPPEQLIFLDENGEEFALGGEMEGFSGYFHPIDRLDAESSITVETQVGFRESVEPYMGATLRFTIWIGDIDEPGQWHPVQSRDLTVRLEPAYAYRPNSRVLLVSNNNTNREAFLAWYHVLEDSLGLKTDFWSISRYGHFDHETELADGANLRGHLDEQVVVVLNQHFEPRASSETDLPTDYMRSSDVRESVSGHGTRYLIVGEPDFEMEQWLEPNTELRLGGSDFDSVSQFLEHEAQSAGTFVEETFRDDITACFDIVTATSWTFPLFQPRATKLYSIAEKVQKKLSKLFPNRRYVVVCDPLLPAERAGRTWCYFPRWKLGTLQVRRTLNLEKSETVTIEASDDEINDESFITGEEARYALGLALSFETKLNRLDWLMRQDEDQFQHFGLDASMGTLIQAMVADLTTEQVAARNSNAEDDEDFYEQRFANFGRLMRYPFYTDVPKDSRKWAYLFEFCAGIEAMTTVQDGGWLFRRRDRRITEWVLEKMEGFKSRLFDGHAIDADGNVAMDSATAGTEIEATREHLVEYVRKMHKSQSWRDRWRYKLRHVGQVHFQNPRRLAERVERDVDLMGDEEERVWRIEELERAREDEAAREDKQAELKEINEEVRDDLLVQCPETVIEVERDDAVGEAVQKSSGMGNVAVRSG